ncbi:LAMI_0A06656g1_1 [Lachancea mirantina]|uniref:LAMI_0A06656g1_1 n=1 Tax=Lachancea mirantina TaxID=1230905 RepID=A0A1G4IQI0_9SACH|nr:LAMI_0A06656g1_1 [Lachancea mirantina]
MNEPNEKIEHRELSRELQKLVSSNSELGSRLLSLLLVSTGNGKEIIQAVNGGGSDGASSGAGGGATADYTEAELAEFRRIEQEKKRKNTEASARFRVRKKQREQEKLATLKQLNNQISELYVTIDRLLDENKFLKLRLEEVNEKKSQALLDNLRRRHGSQ